MSDNHTLTSKKIQQHPPNKPFRIIALDGGGVRAIVQATILNRLIKEYPSLIEEADMFAGVSAGSIVALALSNGLSPQQTIDLWKKEAPIIFTQGIRNKIGTLDNVIGPAYFNDELKSMLEQTLGNKTFGDLHKKILVPSFNLDKATDSGPDNHKWTPEYYHNFSHSKNMDLPLSDACLRSAAAPTYFPIYQGCVDGGTYANNPALLAVVEAVRSGIPVENIVVYSISTGSNPKWIPEDKYKNGNWGLLEWGPYILDVMMDANTACIDHQCQSLLGKRYFRLDPILPKPYGLDQASAIPDLEKFAEGIDLETSSLWLEEYWNIAREKEVMDNIQEIIDDMEQLNVDTNENDESKQKQWGCVIQ